MNDIYSWVKEQEGGFIKPIDIVDGWSWSFKDHIRRCFLYKHSQFEKDNEDRDMRPVKNIVRGILDVRYRTEGFDVKDIELYVNDSKNFHKSFIIKKFHEDWAPENKIDTLIDDIVESASDYGGALVKNVDEVRPEVVDLQSIVFCNQHTLLGRPFGIKHYMSPDELRDKEASGWGGEGSTIDIEEFITLTEDEQKKHDGDIEVYEIYGILPEKWLKGGESKKGVRQLQVIAYYRKKDTNEEQGVTLFKSKAPKDLFKMIIPDPVYNRALGWGCIEALFEPQMWTNFSEIQMMEMLAAASKILFKSSDPAFKTRNNLNDVDNMEVLTLQQGGDINQLDTAPRNMVVFENAVRKWQEQAQYIESSSEAVLGQQPSSGTPFKLYEAQVIEGKGVHHYRQGKYAVFMDELYRDWILQYFSKEIVKSQKFFKELSADEFQSVMEKIVDKKVSEQEIEMILSGETPTDRETLKQQIRESFIKQGSRRLFEILKGEFADAPIKVKTNIVNKQKNLSLLTDKVVNVLRQFIATPQLRQDQDMIKLLNTILESSGLSPIIFGASQMPAQPQSPQQASSTKPLEALSQTNA